MAKYTVEFNEKMEKKLAELAKQKGLTKVDVLRRAVTLYEYAEREAGMGSDKKLSITKDGKTLQDIVLP